MNTNPKPTRLDSIRPEESGEGPVIEPVPRPTRIRRILVPLDPSPYCQAAIETACILSKRHNAHLDGLAVLDIPEMMGMDLPFQAWLRPEMQKLGKQRQEDASNLVSEMAADFLSRCRALGVDGSASRVQGVPAACILESASFHDLLVIGLRTFYHFETRTGPGDSLSKVLENPPTPVLAVPKQVRPELNKVLVAFDGSPSSVRALRSLADLAVTESFAVDIVMASKDQRRATRCVEQAALFLASHGVIEITTRVSPATPQEAILGSGVKDFDLVVAGIHGKKSVKGIFVGSLTRALINLEETALLLH